MYWSQKPLDLPLNVQRMNTNLAKIEISLLYLLAASKQNEIVLFAHNA